MTIPSVGPLVAITFKSAIDDPGRIAKSKTVGALFGLVPKKYQSGERDVSGGITRTGDESVRTALYEAANVMLTRTTRFSSLKRWALEVAKRRGLKRARVALARKLGVVLHRIWVDGTTFSWIKPNPRHCRVKLEERGLREALGKEPTLPRSRRRDDGSGEAVSFAVVIIVR